MLEQPQEQGSVLSSTPLPRGKCLFPESHNATDLSSTLHQTISNETVGLEVFFFFFSVFKLFSKFYCSTSSVLIFFFSQITTITSHLVDESYAEIQVNKVDTSDAHVDSILPVWPTVAVPQKQPGSLLVPLRR